MIVSMSTVRGFGFLRHVLLLALAFGGLPAHTARAADNGWFDPQAPAATANAAAAPAAESPAASAATGDGQAAASDGRDLPALAPSPLLDNRGTQAQQAPAQAPDPEETNPRALTEFRTQLDPYGTWVQHPNYGTVWVPSATVVGTGFSPYVSAGRWALDNDSNWIWVSDYPFGRVVFHYGRWVWIGGTGWAWVPGYRYAPAWVVWRVPTGSYSYVGWAPMGPSYLWYGGFAVSFWYGAYHPYYYCPSTYVFHHHVDHYVVRDPALVHHLGNNTRVYTPASARGVSARTPANPSGGPARPGGGGPAYPGSGPGRPGGPGASPALAAARVPPRSIPSERVSAASQMAGAVPRGRAEHFVSPHMDRARPSFSRSTGFTSGRSSPSGARTFDSSSPRPSFSSPRASSSGSRPSFSGSRPSFSGSRPSASFGGSRPSFSSPRPSFSGSRPSSSFSGARPTPSFSGSRPSFSGSRPSFGGGSRPSFGGGSHGSFGGGSRGGGGGGRR